MKNELVIITWEDSALIKDGKKIKALAPNIGGVDSKVKAQVSGVIQIPTRCIIGIERLKEVKT